MKDNNGGYENQLFREEDFTGEEEEMPSFRGRARGGCVRCEQSRSLQLAVKVLYAFVVLLVVVVAVLASLVFRRVDSLVKEESVYYKRITKVQEGLEGLSSTSNCSGCLGVSQCSEELGRLRREFEDIQRLVLGRRQALDQATQTQTALTSTSNQLTRDTQNQLISIRLLNQSLERYLGQVEGWKEVIKETEEKMKTLTDDQYEVKATAQQVNTTVALSTMWIGALQRKADEDSLVLQKLTSDWQNYSQVLGSIKANTSSTTQTLRSVQNNVVADHQRIAMSTEVYYDLTQQVMNLHMQLDNVTSFMDEHEENMHDLHYHSRYYENRTGERFSALEGRLKSIAMEIDTVASSINATVSHVQSMYKYISIESASCQGRLGRHTEELQNLNNTVLLLLHLADTLRQQNMLLNVRLDVDVRNLSMVMEEMKLVDVHHTQIIKNFSILKGAPGPSGPKGNRGETGPKGPMGLTGSKGDQGLIGSRGSVGEKGSVGPKGPPGETGSSGSRGTAGLKGDKGSLGLPGPRGEKGQKGENGIPGLSAPRGNQGEPGLPGTVGPMGPKGKPGPPGQPGPPGPPGLPGFPNPHEQIKQASRSAAGDRH